MLNRRTDFLQRLKHRLGLPKIDARPPCPPKVYQKLYRYLDAELAIGARRTGRRSVLESSKLPPASRKSFARESRAVSSRFLEPGSKGPNISPTSFEAPMWVMPVIRDLCKKLGAPAAPHHIYTGVSSILATLNMSHEISTVNIPALIIVVFIFVTTRLTGVETDPHEFDRRREKALETIKIALQRISESTSCSGEDVARCMREAREHQWVNMDWFSNVKVGSGLDRDAASVSDEDVEDLEEDSVMIFAMRHAVEPATFSEEYLQPGLGTMLEERTDYLSDAKTRSYEQWRTRMLAKIDSLESQS